MKILLITPPFTQLNTSYPATAYLKGFLNTLHIESHQIDLSLEVMLSIFSKKGLEKVFDQAEEMLEELSDNALRIWSHRSLYVDTIDAVIRFLQNKNPTLAYHICTQGFLPQADRFRQASDLEWAFGTMGIQDKARHLATLYLEDLGDLILEAVDDHFGFNRYAERLARTATHFDDLYFALQEEETIITEHLLTLLRSHMDEQRPKMVCLTAPFPGNVFCAFKCGQFIKKHYPDTKVVFGGGYANTELRSIYDERVFEFVDFITLDDGEAPIQHLIEYLQGSRPKAALKRTFCLENGAVMYCNGSPSLDIPQREVGTPDYGNLRLDEYLSVIEVANPMHRLWSDGRWNKLTLAHGCYWGKCSFCDVTLDYIKRYEPVSAAIICDRMETIIHQTGQNGFHFVDEAAPPALMRDVAIEILKRRMTVVWWTNIRFEKSFTKDLCLLLQRSGCIAISGGLEVAADRLLEKMKKGVTVAQVAQVAHAFTEAGMMVHAYLMYGFPTQTAQETINSLEMVRQMFECGVIQSGFWHQFAMTAHSPVGLEAESYGVVHEGPTYGGFAENDFFHSDPLGTEHERFADGLKNAIHHYMMGANLELSLDEWFDFEVPLPDIDVDYIHRSISEKVVASFKSQDKVVWIGGPAIELIVSPIKKNKGIQTSYAQLIIAGIRENESLYFDQKTAEWLVEMLEMATPDENKDTLTYQTIQNHYNTRFGKDILNFLNSEGGILLRSKGLLIL